MRIPFCHLRHPRSNKGFTLVEVLVAILVGLIVMGMSIAILGSTNSTALRVIAKSEAQINTRDSISKVFSELADADSLEVCRIADRKEYQAQLDQTLTNPARKPLGHPTFDAGSCKETSSTGYVIAIARPNQLCYYKVPHHGASFSTAAPDVVCISRGGTSAWKLDFPSGTLVTAGSTLHGIDISTCVPGPGTDEDLVYKYTCNASAGDSIKWPTSVTGVSNSSVIADLGSNVIVSNSERSNLFNYVPDGDPAHTDLSNIIGVDITFNIQYQNGKGTNTSRYNFKQSIVLRKSLTVLKEGYDD